MTLKHIFLDVSVYVHFFYKTEKNAVFKKNPIRTKVFGMASNVCSCIQEASDLAVGWDVHHPETLLACIGP